MPAGTEGLSHRNLGEAGRALLAQDEGSRTSVWKPDGSCGISRNHRQLPEKSAGGALRGGADHDRQRVAAGAGSIGASPARSGDAGLGGRAGLHPRVRSRKTQLFPGLHSIPGYGHTPDQSYYVLESEGQKMTFWGDIMHVPDIQFANPNITIKFDVDSTAALARRKKDFADAARNRTLVAMRQMYFPGVGRL